MNPLPLRAISNFNNALLDQQFDEAAIQMAIIETNDELRHEFVNAQPDYPLHDALREGAPVALIARITKLGRPESLNENRGAWNWLANRTINNSSDAPIEARVQEYAEIAKHFIDAGIGTDNLVERRWHAAHILISHLGNVSPATAIELLDYLRSSDAGFTLNSVDEIGETPLHLALWHLNFPIATYLIEHGADVNASTVGGWCALGYLCRDTDGNSPKLPDQEARVLEGIRLLQRSGYAVPLHKDQDKLMAHYSGNSHLSREVQRLFSVLEGETIEQSTPTPTLARVSPRL